MHAEVAWVLVSSETQVQPQVILNPDYLLYYLSVSYDYGWFKFYLIMQGIAIKYIINYILLDTHHSQEAREGTGHLYPSFCFFQQFTKSVNLFLVLHLRLNHQALTWWDISTKLNLVEW